MARKKSSEIADDIEKDIEDREVDPQKSPVEFISTGCIPLNLALSQKGRDGGFARGRIVNIVGDGSSGKTILALETCAWLYYNYKKLSTNIYPEIKKLIIVYNNGEGVMDFPLAQMFGEEFYNAVEWTFIPTCEGFGRDIQKRLTELKDGHCLFYVQDSIDSAISEAEKERIEKFIKSGKQEESYGLEGQKFFSQSFFKDLCSRQHGKDATIVLVSQVRENLKAGMFGKKFYRTGGKSLDFYTHQVLWLYHKEKMKKTFRGNERSYGVKTLGKVERNKTAIPFREADFPIIFDYGIDNVMAMADFLFGPKDKEIEWKEERLKKSDLVNLAYENRDILEEMIDEVEFEWKEIEDNIKTKRPSKY